MITEADTQNTLIEKLIKRAQTPEQAYTMMQNLHPDMFEYYPPLLPEFLQMVEQRLGFKLPSFVRDVYCRVANGGFGPGYGLNGLTDDGHLDEYGLNALDLYFIFTHKPEKADSYTWWWPEQLIPICDYGEGLWMCLDCTSPEGRIIRREPATHVDCRDDFTKEFDRFEDWLQSWIDGRLIEAETIDTP